MKSQFLTTFFSLLQNFDKKVKNFSINDPKKDKLNQFHH